jgi:hypothetical protein
MVSPENAIAHSSLDKIANHFGRAASSAYLAFNPGSSLLQCLGVPRFLPFAGPARLITPTARVLKDPLIALGKFVRILPEDMLTRTQIALDVDPQLAARRGDANLDALRRAAKTAKGALGTVTRGSQAVNDVGFFLMEAMDRWSAAIGYTATYEHCLYDLKMSEEDARKTAQRAVLISQQATSVKDTSRIWRESAFVRVMNMLFASESARTWNMLQYDFLQGLRAPGWNGKKQALLTLFALSMTATLTEVMKHGTSPEDDEYGEEPTAATYAFKYVIRPFTEQTINAIPVFGREAMALYDRGRRGYSRGNESLFVAPVVKFTQGLKYFTSEDREYDDLATQWRQAGKFLESAALISPIPIPYIGIKRAAESAYMALEEEDPGGAALNILGRQRSARDR